MASLSPTASRKASAVSRPDAGRRDAGRRDAGRRDAGRRWGRAWGRAIGYVGCALLQLGAWHAEQAAAQPLFELPPYDEEGVAWQAPPAPTPRFEFDSMAPTLTASASRSAATRQDVSTLFDAPQSAVQGASEKKQGAAAYPSGERRTAMGGAFGSTTPPGFMPALGRFRGLAPVAPSVVSAHAAPWDQLPTPAELQGAKLQVDPPCHDCRSCASQYASCDFSPDQAICGSYSWNACGELEVYGAKAPVCGVRPIVELGFPLYPTGPIPPSRTGLGWTNPVQPKLYVYGDFRTAVAQNNFNDNTRDVWASRLNLEIDFWLTATERFHMFWGPLDEANQFTSVLVESGDMEVDEHFDGWDETTDTMYLEGDLGYLVGGLQGIDAPFDLPFAVGLIPLLFQNGVWLEDAFVGAAATIPARNQALLDWSNFDTTFFVGFEELTTKAFATDADEANLVGVHAFIDRRGGYIEAGWAFVDDPNNQGLSYHNVGLSYSRRYLNKFSSAARLIANFGQDGPQNARTADGFVVLLENSLLTPNPYHFVPYFNLFAGFDNPQPLGRLQGPLKNTGINLESDALTGYAFLDDTANNTYGGALGLDFIAGADFDRQLILEFATVQTYGAATSRRAVDDQYALGMRWQQTLNNAWIFRSDLMYGFLDDARDISGMRAELRRKF